MSPETELPNLKVVVEQSEFQNRKESEWKVRMEIVRMESVRTE